MIYHGDKPRKIFDFCAMYGIEQMALQLLISTLPRDPIIVELGSFVGGSIAVMHMARPDARFVVFEDFQCDTTCPYTDQNGNTLRWYDLQGIDQRTHFHTNTDGIDLELHDMHLSRLEQLSPYFDSLSCDLVFDDLALEPWAMRYWIDRLRPGGIMCGHDYISKQWVDDAQDSHELQARQSKHARKIDTDLIDSMAASHGQQVQVLNTFWWWRKP